MTRMTTFFLFWAASSTAFAGTADPYADWASDVASALAAADARGDWQLVAVDPKPADDLTKASLLLDAYRDGSIYGRVRSDVTLKRGIVARSPDGGQAMMGIEPDEIDVAFDGSTENTGILPDEIDVAADGSTENTGIEPDEIDVAADGSTENTGIEPDELNANGSTENTGIEPDELNVLAKAYPAYLVVDLVIGRDGSTRYAPVELIVGLGKL